MSRSRLDTTFRISLTLKGLDGLLEVIGAILLVLVPPSTVTRLVAFLTQHELSQDPHDLIANYALRLAHHLSPSSIWFGFLYLISHGLIKIVLVAALLKNKLWAYPWMIAFLTLFIGYQLYRLTAKFSIGLVALTIFDIFVAWLTWLEYRRHLGVTPVQ